MVAAEIGPGSAFVARTMALQVAPNGRVIARRSIASMAAYVAERAKSEGIHNLSTLVVQSDGGRARSRLARRRGHCRRLRQPDRAARDAAIGGRRAQAGRRAGSSSICPRKASAPKPWASTRTTSCNWRRAAGLKREAESTVVPGHYAIRFRKPTA
jgi:hypothetical protein